MDNIRNYFVEDAKSEQIVFKGSEDECWEWCEAKSKEEPERAFIIRKATERRINNEIDNRSRRNTI